jgi:hypothetical protein
MNALEVLTGVVMVTLWKVVFDVRVSFKLASFHSIVEWWRREMQPPMVVTTPRGYEIGITFKGIGQFILASAGIYIWLVAMMGGFNPH